MIDQKWKKPDIAGDRFLTGKQLKAAECINPFERKDFAEHFGRNGLP